MRTSFVLFLRTSKLILESQNSLDGNVSNFSVYVGTFSTQMRISELSTNISIEFSLCIDIKHRIFDVYFRYLIYIVINDK